MRVNDLRTATLAPPTSHDDRDRATRGFRLPEAMNFWAMIFVAAVLSIVAWQRVLIGDYRVDDTYISLDYAKNLVNGLGLTYGAGLRVEGYSNFLWVLVAAVVRVFAPNHVYEGLRSVAFGCFGIVLWLTFRICARYVSTAWSVCAVILTAMCTDYIGAAQSALETIPYTAAVLTAVYCYSSEDPLRRRASGWCFLLLCLLRIDGVVLVAFFMGWFLISSFADRRWPGSRASISWLAAPALIYAIYFSWRFRYYGLPLPTTYYAKSLIRILLPTRGVDYAVAGARQLGLFVAAVFALFGLGRNPARDRLMMTFLILGHVGYICYVGGDWMPFHRFLVPILPLLTVLFVWGLSDAWRVTAALRPSLRAGLGLLLTVAIVLVLVLEDAHTINTPEERVERDLRLHVAAHTRDLIAASAFFKWMMRAPGERVVTDYGGVFAYFTNADIIEMWGLCNADIAVRGDTKGVNPVFGKTCIACYRNFHADYFHANVPLLRPSDAFKSDADVIKSIFQGEALDRELDFHANFVTGRVVDRARGLAFFFLERKRPGASFSSRYPAPGIFVDYPFLGAHG